jgi:hypothetical protein
MDAGGCREAAEGTGREIKGRLANLIRPDGPISLQDTTLLWAFALQGANSVWRSTMNRDQNANPAGNPAIQGAVDIVQYLGEVLVDPKKAAGHLLTLLQYIPIHGSVIHANITEYTTNRKFERIENLFSAFGGRVARLEGRIHLDVIKSDEFAHLLVHAIDRAQYEHRKLKIKMLGYTLAELASDKWDYLFDVQERLVDIVAEMGEDQAEVLELLAARGVQPLIVGSHNPLSLLDLFTDAKLIQHLEPRRREIVLKAAMDWLEVRGLAVRSHNRDGSNVTEDFQSAMRNSFMDNEHCSITDVGLDLAAMIRSEPKEDFKQADDGSPPA